MNVEARYRTKIAVGRSHCRHDSGLFRDGGDVGHQGQTAGYLGVRLVRQPLNYAGAVYRQCHAVGDTYCGSHLTLHGGKAVGYLVGTGEWSICVSSLLGCWLYRGGTRD